MSRREKEEAVDGWKREKARQEAVRLGKIFDLRRVLVNGESLTSETRYDNHTSHKAYRIFDTEVGEVWKRLKLFQSIDGNSKLISGILVIERRTLNRS